MRGRLESGIAWRWAEPQVPEAIDEDGRPTGRYPVAPVVDWDADERPTTPCGHTLAELAAGYEDDEALERLTAVG